MAEDGWLMAAGSHELCPLLLAAALGGIIVRGRSNQLSLRRDVEPTIGHEAMAALALPHTATAMIFVS